MERWEDGDFGHDTADVDDTPEETQAIRNAVAQALALDRELPLAAVLSRARIGLLHRDRQRRVVAVNDRFCELAGRDAAALSGLAVEALLHPDDLSMVTALYARHQIRSTPFEVEARFVRPDGSSLWCDINVSFVCDAAGVAVSTITIAQDISARRAAEERMRESEEHYRHTVELNPQITWTAGPGGQIESVSSRWETVTGGKPSEALGARWLVALHPEDRTPTEAAWRKAIASGAPVDIEYRLRSPEGDFRWFRSRAAARCDAAGATIRWYGTLEDIHDRKLAERALRDSEKRFRLAAHAAGLGIWDYNALTGTREWSDELKAMLGLPLETPAAVALALARVVPADRHRLQALIAAVEAGDGNHRFETTLRILRADTGAERWIKTGGWRIEAPSGRLSRVLVTTRDVTEERTAQERIRFAAHHDSLTGLPNRATFNERLETAIANSRHHGGGVALVLIDVDHLKETNDTVGHDAGDAVLRALGERVHGVLGDGCMVARLGGDEFAAVIESPGEAAAEVARVRAALAAVREPLSYDGRILDCQATAGGSLFPAHGATATELLKAADIALYAAKANSRGELLMFEPPMRADLQRRSSMLSIARDIIRDDRILPYYQPKIAFASGTVCGFEALLRWHHPTYGAQLPATIAAAFEDYDLAQGLSERMLGAIVGDMRRWLDAGLDFGRIAFNLSPAEFRRDDLTDRILGRLARAGVPADRLELEVTETVFVGRGAECVATMLETFHRAGVHIALDDFGTGYASLTHLKAFPVDTIKIDRSFINHLDRDAGDAAIVDAVVALGHRLGMTVVAEGIETEAQAHHLLALGCDIGQGFWFGHSGPSDTVPSVLARRHLVRVAG
ncbi:sensor domain-containing protein [Sphingomonas sp. RIT328]|uniref:sensor domain-containing protein n=1 Tax=Sphingomonas sp. RIT328 TaxID=1470591 RepID=UPI000687F9C5|nr:bifunctional diguanylate cyclase/phosphodiesterase [Sphingomonas sp. RIT328]